MDIAILPKDLGKNILILDKAPREESTSEVSKAWAFNNKMLHGQRDYAVFTVWLILAGHKKTVSKPSMTNSQST